MVHLTTADTRDAAGAERIAEAVRKHWPRLRHLFAADAYSRGRLMGKALYCDFVIEVMCKIAGQEGFQVPSQRWWKGHSAGWCGGAGWCGIMRLHDASEAMIHVSMGALPFCSTARP